MSLKLDIRRDRGTQLSIDISYSHARRIAGAREALVPCGWDDKRMLQRFFLKSEDFGKTGAGQELHVEDLFYGRLEVKCGDGVASHGLPGAGWVAV